VTAGKALDLNGHGSSRSLLKGDRQLAAHIHTTSATAHQYTLILRVQIDQLVTGQLGAVKSKRAKHSDFLVGSDKGFNRRMCQRVIAQDRKDHCHSNTVIAAQCCTLGSDVIAVHINLDTVGEEVEVHAFVLLADHIVMALQNNRISVFVPCTGGLADNHIICRIPVALQSVLFSKTDQVGCYAVCVA